MNMNRFLPNVRVAFVPIVLCLLILPGLSGCKEDVVYQRSISELNQKAQTMMQSGDYEGAVARLEAAHDLNPAEPNTMYNLAIAYQTKGDYDKAISIFTQLLQKPGPEGSPLSAAGIRKDLGITYEAKADKLEADAKALEETPKGDKAKAQAISQQSTEALQQALAQYKQALPGLNNSSEIASQIQAIETKLSKTKPGAQP